MLPAARTSRTLLRFVLVCAVCLPGLTAPARASKVRPMDLEEMTERAGRIISGRCLRVRAVEESGIGLPATEVTFQVDRTLKGKAGDLLTIRQPASLPGAGEARILGLPRFRPGEEVILFLYGESASGLTSPVGLGQGKFTVFTDKAGRRWAVNGHGNRNLSRGRAAEAGGPAAEAHPGIAADLLLERVRTLLRPEPGDRGAP